MKISEKRGEIDIIINKKMTKRYVITPKKPVEPEGSNSEVKLEAIRYLE